MKKSITLLLLLQIGFLLRAQTSETESNNTFATANFIGKDSIKTGSVNNSTDPYDYFMTVIPHDGTMKIYLSATNTSGVTGYAYLYGYDGRKGSGQTLGRYIGNTASVGSGKSVTDTLNLYGRGVDTFYFRIETSGSFSYSIRYAMRDTSINDAEPNGAFSNALPLVQLQEKQGHVHYTAKGSTDDNDYYRTLLPYDGTLKVYVKATNMNGSTGYLYLNMYDGRKGSGQILGRYVSNNASISSYATVYDTIYLYGRAIDSTYFQFSSSGAFQYSFHYEMLDTGMNDAEPNGSFASAASVLPMQEKKGHVHYSANGGVDDNDYYKTLLPSDGTLKVYVKATNMNGTTGYFYLNIYDGRKGTGQILGRYVSNNASIQAKATVYDTIYLYGRAIDSTYFHFSSSGAFQYSFQYEIQDTGMNDAEPNGSFATAASVLPVQEKKGHVHYSANGGADDNDYYKTLLPADGTLKVYVKATNMLGSTGYLYLNMYDGRKGTGQILGRYISGNASISSFATIYDTIYLYGRAVDSTYFQFSSSGAFQYSFHYEMLDTGSNDAEPNGSFAGALPILPLQEKKGHVHYSANGGVDDNDYYTTLLPSDGTLKVYVKATNMNGTTGYFYLNIYDGRKGTGQILGRYVSNNASIPAKTTVYDTIYLYGRGVDSTYFHFNSSGAFQYSLKYEMIDTSSNDKEPNGIISQAIDLIPSQVKKGHIHYAAKGGTDDYDYYRAVLPSDGTVRVYLRATNQSGNTNYFYINGYDGRKLQGMILGKYISNNSSITYRSSITDTIDLFCRAKDTLYFRLESSAAFHYEISYNMVNQSTNDAEPNNSFENAIAVALGQKKQGHIGYYKEGSPDGEDYYKVAMPKNGSVRIITELINTGTGGGYAYIYGYDQRKGSGNVLGKYIANNSNLLPGVTYRDTIFVNCFNSDTFYLRWTAANCFKYNFSIDFIDRKPKANTENERIGNTVGFRPQFTNADKFIWEFGDGTTSTLKYPMKTFKIGYYVTRLIVTNSVCGIKDTAQEIFEVKGVEYYTPDSSGTGGDAIIKVFGGGLDTATRVSLKQGSTEIFPIRKYASRNNAQLDLIFDLHLINEGVYDVIIKIPGENTVTYPNGFRIGKFRYPYTWSEVVAPARWRTNVDNKFKLVIGNKGNVNASGVIVALIWPKTVDLKFDTKWFSPPASGNYTIKTKDTTINCKWEDIRYFYTDSFRNSTTTAIDSFCGKPYNGYMKIIMIPKIAGGSTYEIPLIARSSSVSAQNFITYTYANIFGSCPDGNWMDVSENMAVEGIDLIDRGVSATPVLSKSPVSWLVKATKGTTTHMANLGQAMGAFYNYLDGTTNSIDESLPADYYANVDAGNAQVGKAILDAGVDKMVDAGIGKVMKGQSDNINNFLANNPNAAARSIEFAKDNLKDINDIRQTLKDIYKGAKDAQTLEQKLKRLDELLKDCPDLKKQADELKKQLEKDMTIKDPKETKTNSVTSLDPNAIYGPVGQGPSNKFLNTIDRQNFLVTFENVDTAQASAQIVTVLDTLDKKKFDLRTFEFTDYTIGIRTFNLPKGRKQFVVEDSLNPTMRVRVNGQLDTAKGIITWQFTAIDPVTGDIPVFEGFLPPNIKKPEGEGGVSYTVQPWSSLADGSRITNRASIIFDNNPAIATNTWENVIDVVPPTSTVTATKGPGIPTIQLNFSGSDASSGVGYYNLYMKIDNGDWLPFGGASTPSLVIKAAYGHKYSFCALAIDMVGNVENKALTEESTLDLTAIESELNKLVLRPNPAGNTVSIDGMDKFQTYQVTDISGRIVLGGTIQPGKEQLDISTLRPGMYIITITGSSVQSLKLLKL